MGKRYRRWKLAAVPILVAAGYQLIVHAAEASALWYAGLALVVALGLAYLVEELVGIARGRGRPCARCGHRFRMRSFRIQNTCPQCGTPW